VNQPAAGVDDVGHVAVAFAVARRQKHAGQFGDDTVGMVQIEEHGTDRVLAHRADSVGEYQPAAVGLDGRAAVAGLDEFPAAVRYV